MACHGVHLRLGNIAKGTACPPVPTLDQESTAFVRWFSTAPTGVLAGAGQRDSNRGTGLALETCTDWQGGRARRERGLPPHAPGLATISHMSPRGLRPWPRLPAPPAHSPDVAHPLLQNIAGIHK